MKKLICSLLAVTVLLSSCAQQPSQSPEDLPDTTSGSVKEEVTAASSDEASATVTEATTTQATTTQATTTEATTTAKPHECESVCEICGLCLDVECYEDVCRQKCNGHLEEPYEFKYSDWYITDKDTIIDTGKIVYNIESGIFVPGHIEEITEVFVPMMEEITGHSFDGVKDYANGFEDGKSHVLATRSGLYVDYDWYQGFKRNEFGSAWASAQSHAQVAPGDILYFETVVHELGHVLMNRQTEWYYDQMLNEGYTEYTVYRVAQKFVNEHPEYLFYFNRTPEYQLMNLTVHSYDELYSQPITHWIDNSFEHASNNNYAIGFRFMWYLDDVYGDYTKWVDEAERLYPFDKTSNGNDTLEKDRIIEIFKSAYGDDVWDNFYDWMKKNEDLFETSNKGTIDLSSVDEINIYPMFNAIEESMILSVSGLNNTEYTYNDLYINLEPARAYIEEYKQLDASALVLNTGFENVKINLYKSDGSYETVTVKGKTEISEEVSYIKLVGKGSFKELSLSGFSDNNQ